MKIQTIKSNQAKLNKTLQGVLINNHVKDVSFNEIQNSLLITDSEKYYSGKKQTEKKESSFDVKKAIKPLLIGTMAVLGGTFAISAVLKKSSQNLLNTKNFEHLPDLAINMNIREEPQFALYRAIRDPNYKNILGAAAVFLMSGITITCKNFVEGAKEIWTKKQSADVEKDLQEKLIEVETNSFSGKLKVVNDLMSENVKYFDSVLNKQESKTSKANIFSGFLSFKGEENKKEQQKKKFELDNKNLKYIALVVGVITGAVLLGKMSFSNLKKTAKITNDFANNYTEKTIDAINNLSQKADKNDLPKIIEYFKSICAKPDYIRDVAKKYNLENVEVQSIIKVVEESKKTIFSDAPTALGGIPKKIQYYCYIDENRGHLYNWIMNPENKFTKYIFAAFTTSSAIGYLFKQGMDAIKDVTVIKENAKTELDLRKRLVDVEIANFKAKKESAIRPLVETFSKQAVEGKKSKEELKQIADNILVEVKNGPPYVYN